jgi:hypothetical protein
VQELDAELRRVAGGFSARSRPTVGPIPERETRRCGVEFRQFKHLGAAAGDPDGNADCDHVHDVTTRYDRDARRLDFFLFCPVCRTAKLVHSLDYEPRFEPTGATLHALRPREDARPERRAA